MAVPSKHNQNSLSTACSLPDDAVSQQQLCPAFLLQDLFTHARYTVFPAVLRLSGHVSDAVYARFIQIHHHPQLVWTTRSSRSPMSKLSGRLLSEQRLQVALCLETPN